MSAGTWCRECRNPSDTLFCQACFDKSLAKCAHGNDASECDACFKESDHAFDAWREDKG